MKGDCFICTKLDAKTFPFEIFHHAALSYVVAGGGRF